MDSGYFITGIDTDTGKTVITAALLRYFRQRSRNAIAMKPVQTGCQMNDGQLIVPDVSVYEAATQMPYQPVLEHIAPYCYQSACSPHLAAQSSGNYPSIPVILDHLKQLQGQFDPVLIEGAGGVLVPLDQDKTMLDLMKAINLPIIVCAANRLGVINHTLLTIDVLQRHQLDIKGIIITHVTPIQSEEEQAIRQDNSRTIAQKSKLPILAEIPYLENFKTSSEDDWQRIDNYLTKLEDQ